MGLMSIQRVNNSFYYPYVVVVVYKVWHGFHRHRLVLFLLRHSTVFYYSENCGKFIVASVNLRFPEK